MVKRARTEEVTLSGNLSKVWRATGRGGNTPARRGAAPSPQELRAGKLGLPARLAVASAPWPGLPSFPGQWDHPPPAPPPRPLLTLRSPAPTPRAAAAGKRKVCAAQSDAKILKELFGGGYLEIRPCEGTRVQIRPRGRQLRHKQRPPQGLEGARVAPPRRARASLPTDGRQVGARPFRILMHTSLQNFTPLCLARHWGACAVGFAAALPVSTGVDSRRAEGQEDHGATSGLWRAPLSTACWGF